MTRVAGAGVGVSSVEGEATDTLGVWHLAHVGALVPELLVPGARLVRFERLGAVDEDTEPSRVALVVELAANGGKGD